MRLKIWAGEEGFTLLATMMVVIMVFTLGMAIFQLVDMEARITANQALATEALYLAEAGVEMAIHQLEGDPTWGQGYTNFPLGRGVIQEVVVEQKPNNMPNMVRIESQAKVKGVGRRLRVDLEKAKVPAVDLLQIEQLILDPYSRMSLTGDAVLNGNLLLNTAAVITGDLTVDGEVDLDRLQLQGSIAATGFINVRSGATVAGDLISQGYISYLGELTPETRLFPSTAIRPPLRPEPWDFAWYENRYDYLIEETEITVDALPQGISLTEEDLRISPGAADGTYQGNIVIVAKGDLIVDTNLLPVNPEKDGIIIVADNIELTAAAEEVWAVLMTKNSLTMVNGMQTKRFFGSLQATSLVVAGGNLELVYYPLAGGHVVQHPQTLFRLIKWLEIIVEG